MRVLNSHTLRFDDGTFKYGEHDYAIVSHRWRNEEVDFREMLNPTSETPLKSGYKKIENACQQAVKDKLDYLWIDTCCIDKSSSAELSEAINSMYAWYFEATVCYAYLDDVPDLDDSLNNTTPRSELSITSRIARPLRSTEGECSTGCKPTQSWSFDTTERPMESKQKASWFFNHTEQPMKNGIELPLRSTENAWFTQFGKCEWLKRGWTLQELVAPRALVFYSRYWTELGRKSTLYEKISEITGIDSDVLAGGKSVLSMSVAQRMSWVSGRKTTRPEDLAYCLMGLFDVNMPMLYGEGGEKAFIRLQEEIMAESDDESMFAWKDDLANPESLCGLLAKSPACFQNCGDHIPYREFEPREPFSKTNRGLRISLHVNYSHDDIWIASVKCPHPTTSTGFLGFYVKHLDNDAFGTRSGETGNNYARTKASELIHIENEKRGVARILYVRQNVHLPRIKGADVDRILQLKNSLTLGQGYFLYRTMGPQKGTGWIPTFSSINFSGGHHTTFRMKNDELAVLVVKRVLGRKKFAIMFLATPDLGLATDAVADWNFSQDLESLKSMFKPHPIGFEMDLGSELVRVETETSFSSGRIYYTVDVKVGEKEKLITADPELDNDAVLGEEEKASQITASPESGNISVLEQDNMDTELGFLPRIHKFLYDIV